MIDHTKPGRWYSRRLSKRWGRSRSPFYCQASRHVGQRVQATWLEEVWQAGTGVTRWLSCAECHKQMEDSRDD